MDSSTVAFIKTCSIRFESQVRCQNLLIFTRVTTITTSLKMVTIDQRLDVGCGLKQRCMVLNKIQPSQRKMPNCSSDLCPYSRCWHISWSQGDGHVMIGIQQALLQKHAHLLNPFNIFQLRALNIDKKGASRQIQKKNSAKTISHIMHTYVVSQKV